MAALVIAAGVAMGWEWARLTGQRSRAATAAIVLTVALPTVAITFGANYPALVLVAVGVLAVMVAARGAATVWAPGGTAWIALACLACLWIERDSGRAAVLWLFATVWATDTGAYILGRSIGGPRLAPALSPNKTWAGFAGGLFAAATVTWGAARIAGTPVAALMPAGLALSVAAQVGDLAESLAKRRFGVKDSGRLIPGHGGVLDRLDGMLAAAAMEWALTFAAGASPFLWRV